MDTYLPNGDRYENAAFYRRCGRSGIKLPLISLGLWHNFGGADIFENGRAIARRAFDLGITHFDLANNYGPPYGSAEETFGRLLQSDFAPFRDELIISTKAGYDMWAGPYGNWGSRKYLLASLDQSLRRMKLDYVDIFYHHRPDPETPLEETAGALAHAVRSGKALYTAISNYPPESTARMAVLLRELGTPCLIHQPKYSMFVREPENGLFDTLLKEGVGSIAFSPLAQGLLTNRYLSGIPADARAGRDRRFLKPEHITDSKLTTIRALNAIAQQRGQTLAQMALAWVLRQPALTTALIGASKPEQVADCVGVARNLAFSAEELSTIDKIITA
ncbi:MAG TPA: L-glyceraldehyde 3-phosphate reductase [Verrucomicrobiae bacterium]|jgi:L-glyceraldehyde 3-phosphate reductase|nr:L-glyceraldehyde 3-phosphate reductase [Verrucomicrobiae bacterium]